MTRVTSHLTSRAAREKSCSEEEKEMDNFANKHAGGKHRKRIDNMNVVDHLLEHGFETLSLEDKKNALCLVLFSLFMFFQSLFPLPACTMS